jgi:hypothetical protein
MRISQDETLNRHRSLDGSFIKVGWSNEMAMTKAVKGWNKTRPISFHFQSPSPASFKLTCSVSLASKRRRKGRKPVRKQNQGRSNLHASSAPESLALANMRHAE